jgi:DNA invertase Pin-like site-specific DNA recombinase
VRFGAYIRVSRRGRRGGPSYITIPVQREEIHRWAKYERVEIAEERTDENWSGGTLERPGFKELLTLIEAGELSGIVVSKLDRFARSLPRAYEAIERIEAAGGRFVSVADKFDLTTSQGRLMFNIMASFAQFEGDRTRESWAVAQERAITRGVHIGPTPIGYLRGGDGRLVPDPATAPAIREVFGLRAEGASWSAIARYLSEHAPGPKAGRWAVAPVAKVLQNRVYLGEVHHGRKLSRVNRNAHEALVSEEEFRAAQLVRPAQPGRRQWLLSGFVRCAACRYTMGASYINRQRSGEPRYRCKAGGGENGRSHKCPHPTSIKASLIEDYVVGQVLKRHQTILRAYEKDSDVDELKEALAAAQADQEAAYAMAAQARNTELASEIVRRADDTVESAAERLQRAQNVRVLGHPAQFTLKDMWEDPHYDVGERRRWLAAVLDCVFLRSLGGNPHAPLEERVDICWAGEAPDDIPSRGRLVPFRPHSWGERKVRIPGHQALDQGGL